MTPRSLRVPVALSAALALGLTLSAPVAVVATPDEDRPTAASPPEAEAAPGSDAELSVDTPAADLPEPASGLWIVRFDEEPLATYHGGTAGLRATSPEATGAERLDVGAPASRAYLDHLAEQQELLTQDLAATLGRDVEVTESYRHAVNGVAVRLAPEEAQLLVDVPGVAAVEPDQQWELDTDVSNEIIGSPAIWEGGTGAEAGTRGEGVIVGMLDTGVNPEHPSFAAVDGDGYAHDNPYGSGAYVGVCDPAAVPHLDICNDKLIGAWDFTGTGAVDDNGHGSHTGSTMAGNRHDAVFTVGADEVTRSVSGVAPRANVISYKVCSFLCSSVASVAAVDQAIVDGTDVLNYSISGPDNPWNNAVDAAFLAAYEAGIFVSASAGNDGPGEGTVAKTAPWNAAVAATNSPRLIALDVSVTGPGTPPEEVVGLAGVPGSGPAFAEPVDAGLREASVVDEGNGRACEAFPADAFAGAIALLERGDCDFSVKVGNVAAAGAVGVVVSNQFAGPPVVMGGLESSTLPAVMVGREAGAALREYVVANPGAQGRLDTSSALITEDEWALMVSDFSSRGPSDFDLLAPTFAAPGRNILAATMADGDDPVQYEFMQGTSMSSPHGAGAGALLRALHPDWSPGEIRSALAATADPSGLVKDDGETPADPYDVGSGMLDLDAAGRVGLVMDESHENLLAADPATGGDPRTLNLPAFVDQNCLDTCTFNRQVTSVATGADTAYEAVVDAPDGVTLTVEPAQFSLAPGATQELTLTADVRGLVGGEALFGDIALTTDGTHPGGADVADVHYPVVLVKAEAEIVVEPTEVDSLLGVDEEEAHTVTVTNAGGAPLEWAVDGSGDCAVPDWAAVEPRSGTLGAGESQEFTVTLNSADRAGGSYEAGLCVASNDPHTPVVTVALSLEVVEIPVAEVSVAEVSTIQPAGAVTQETFTVGNAGYGELSWTLEDPDAGPSQDRIDRLREGVLLVPNSASSHRGVMAFDPEDGTLIDSEFIPHHAFGDSTLYTPNQALPNADGTGFLVADQIQNVITEYDLDGNFVGFFAPTPEGEDRSIMQNIRGMTWSPEGTLVVTVATGVNAGSLVEFSSGGEFLGHYVEPGLGGLAGPWFALFRDADLLVSDSTTESVHAFAPDGSEAQVPFVTGMRWPEQLAQTPEGTVLVANWSTGTDLPPRGVHEYTAAGEHVGHYTAEGNSYAGAYPLGNGNILTTTENGVYEISRDGAVVEQEQTGGRGRFVSEVRMPELAPCVTPDEVPWLTVHPASGEVGRGDADEVAVRLDSAGLEPGEHTAQLCVASNDPGTPYVPVPVTLTVTDQTCDSTVAGVHPGPLSVRDGLTCLAPGADVQGPVTVRSGAALFGDDARVGGPVSSASATGVSLTDSTIDGPVTARSTTGAVVLDGNDVRGAVTVDGTTSGDPALVAENTIGGLLGCRGNTPDPVNDGRSNVVSGARTGQCRGL